MTALFGCLYYAALRPKEAVALRNADCPLPGSGWGMLRLAAATPRTAIAWTSSGTSHEQRGLKHRPNGTIRIVPAPPVLTAMLPCAPCGLRHRTRRPAVPRNPRRVTQRVGLRPCLARRQRPRPPPNDLRHTALSLWLNTGGDPARSPPRAATASRSCSPSTPTASTAATTSSTSRSTRYSRPRMTGPCPSVESQRCAPITRLHGSQRSPRPRDGGGRRPPSVRGRRPPSVRDFPARPAGGPQSRRPQAIAAALSVNV